MQTLFDGKGRGVKRQGVNCTTGTSKHPLFSQSLESWYGWVGGCCITRESRSEDVATMELFDVKRCLLDVKRWSCLKYYMWTVGMKEKTLQGKGKGALKPIALRWPRPFNGNRASTGCIKKTEQI